MCIVKVWLGKLDLELYKQCAFLLRCTLSWHAFANDATPAAYKYTVTGGAVFITSRNGKLTESHISRVKIPVTQIVAESV